MSDERRRDLARRAVAGDRDAAFELAEMLSHEGWPDAEDKGFEIHAPFGVVVLSAWAQPRSHEGKDRVNVTVRNEGVWRIEGRAVEATRPGSSSRLELRYIFFFDDGAFEGRGPLLDHSFGLTQRTAERVVTPVVRSWAETRAAVAAAKAACLSARVSKVEDAFGRIEKAREEIAESMKEYLEKGGAI